MKKYFLILFFIFYIFIIFPAFAQEETLILFDASVSMLEPFDGTPKYISAVKQVKDVLKKFAPSEKIGLRTIGVSVDASLLTFLQNPNDLCKATNLVVPIKSNSNDSINSALDAIFPLGTTPLEYSLSVAINYDFTQDYHTKKHIIFITDGADSCDGDPCRFISETMKTRKDIKIDIIAIGVNADDFEQLNCLTKSTSGRIYSVKNTQELNYAFKNLLNQKPVVKNAVLSEKNKYKNYTFQFNY